jgi:hypothetical protein
MLTEVCNILPLHVVCLCETRLFAAVIEKWQVWELWQITLERKS